MSNGLSLTPIPPVLPQVLREALLLAAARAPCSARYQMRFASRSPLTP